ncbi:MAG TPA: winged helix-turn-helix transcriptional regulator [Acidimicrobiales bacterium]
MDEERQSYGQYCPISRALDVVGERWSLLILRDLILGTTRFNDLSRGLPRLSRALLAKRLRQFERSGLVERVETEYLLTDAGRELESVVLALGQWGARWTFGRPDPDELDPELLAWWMHEGLDTSCFPGKRHVLHLRFTDDPTPFWFVIEDGVPSVCSTDPGYEVDVTIRADIASLYEVWLGELPVSDALTSGRLAFDGPGALVREMPGVLRRSMIAPFVEATGADAIRPPVH